jgi:hypothetical protein
MGDEFAVFPGKARQSLNADERLYAFFQAASSQFPRFSQVTGAWFQQGDALERGRPPGAWWCRSSGGRQRPAASLPRMDGSQAIEHHQLSNAALFELLEP